ncbi:MAG: hypothetical protein IIA68_01745 [Proteobacteria bacterium]|nr:hypothetical protein [Pseudomonadota bacterium]
MRKVLLAGVAAVFGLGISGAMADVTVLANITKTKTILIEEFLNVAKDVDLDVFVISAPDKFAESVALVNQSNEDNEGCGNCAEKTDLITLSGNDNNGIFNINLASGNMMNQATVISASVDARTVGGPPTDPNDPGPTPTTGTVGFAESQAAASQINGGFHVGGASQGNIIRAVNLLFRDATILRSLNDNTGIVYANLGTGNMGNQANVLSLAVSFAEEGVALSEADLGQFNTFNKVFESDAVGEGISGRRELDGINKTARIVNSITANSGIVGVNLTTGNFANQANVVSFSAVAL